MKTTIPTKFNEKGLFPSEIFPSFAKGNTVLITSDKVPVEVSYVAAWHNADERFNDDLDKLCNELYHMPFKRIQNVWRGRLGKLSGSWVYVEMSRKSA